MGHFKSIIGQSPALDSLIRSARMVAATDVTVLLKGETGTGKEVFANAIQKESARADKAYITLNCAALPESLIESELFGHKKGSFTGATANTQGLFQAADGGTLFLDEINSLPVSIQAKLLRFLESGECLAVGDIKPYNVDVRIIAATNSDLNKQVATGEFRQDLYYRINVIDLHVPPLRERSSDIPALTEYILAKLTNAGKSGQPILSTSALAALQQYHFPGNVRELENILERALALYNGKCIEIDDLNLPVSLQDDSDAQKYDPAMGSLEDYLEAIERKAITLALEENKWNKTAAAKQLGLSFRSFRYRIKKLDLDN
jgi:two-component system response regulator PilR (NtrC family)